MSFRVNLPRLRALLGAVVVFAGGSLSAQAPQQGTTITGTVVADDTKEPIAEARIVLVSGNNFATTNGEGRYTLRNLTAGRHEIRVLRVGYLEQKVLVQVTAGAATIQNFSLATAVVKLQQVVTTATGEVRRVELGNNVATMNVAARMEESPVRSLGDLLAAKAPGVQVLPNNMTGGGSRIRIRGTNSFSLSNDPIYVIDGVRMTSGNGSAIGVGGTTQNRANDISPEDIENIEIVKGPSAATLYGTDASNGVILITTKRGRAGPSRWTLFEEHGQLQDRNIYPSTYAIIGHTALSATPIKCVLTDLVRASVPCIADSTKSLNIFGNQDLTPIKLGWRDNYGAQVSGGTEAVRFFISADIQKEKGPLGMPAFNQRAYTASKTALKGEWAAPSQIGGATFRANLNAAVSSKLDVAASMGFIRNDSRLPQVDNNVNSFWYNGMTGPGYTAGPGYTGKGSLGQDLNGYSGFTPGEIFQFLVTQNVQRFIGSTNVNYRPFGWLQARADLGMDLTDRVDFSLCMFATCSDFGTNRLGFASDARTNIRNFTTNMSATATYNPKPWLNLKTTVGMQYVNFHSTLSRATGSTLPPGAQTPAAGTTPSITSQTIPQSTLGAFIEETAAINDRLWLTAAFRSDQNSAFGTNFQRVYYPKFAASWLLSEEKFFPKFRGVDEVRFRASFGASGAQPGPTDALRTFAVSTTAIGGSDISGLRSSLPGNANLRPEQTTEFETGFDLKLFHRLNVEMTYYNKRTKDALFNLTIAPSAGTAATSVRSNLGGTQNTGVEFLVNAQVIDHRLIGIDMTLAASHNGNKLVSLGKDAQGKDLPTIGLKTTVQQASGYPLNGYWARKYTYNDANKDGIIAPGEVLVDTLSNGGSAGLAGWNFVGYSQPRDEVSLTTGIDLMRRRVRFNILMDYKGGYNLLNNLEGFLCPQTKSCAYNSSLTASLADQARAVAVTNQGTQNTAYGFLEPVRFWRLREVSATYNLDENVAKRFLRAQSASFNLGVRNVKIWTKYTGTDPEANYGEGNTQQTLLTAGPPTYYQFRINLHY